MSKLSRVHFSSESGEWETPQVLFDLLDEEFHFTLDVCATPENAKCRQFFTESDNGLKQNWWGEVCWMNPPYGRGIGKWLKKAWMGAGFAPWSPGTIVCLVPVRTSTAWWHDWVARADEVRLLRGRLNFELNGKPILNKDGKPTGAPFPSAIAVFAPRVATPNQFSHWDWKAELEAKED